MLLALQSLALSVWMAAAPAFAATPAAPAISEAIAIAVMEDASNAPVMGSHAEDAALLARIVLEESNVQTLPRPVSWDSKAGLACGAFQLHCSEMPATLVGQARMALWYLHRGKASCPENPAAPYLGGSGRRCFAGLARRIADRRVGLARAALRAAIASVVQEE